jgi:hypothetical protein
LNAHKEGNMNTMSDTATVIEGVFIDYFDGYIWIDGGYGAERFEHDPVLPLYELEQNKGKACKLMIPVTGPARYSRLSFPKG